MKVDQDSVHYFSQSARSTRSPTTNLSNVAANIKCVAFNVTNFVTSIITRVTRLLTWLVKTRTQPQSIKELREDLGWSQERIGVAIGIDESSSRARISRYELGVHEPPVPTARLIASAMGVPLAYMYCEDDKVAALLLALHRMKPAARERKVAELLGQVG